MYLCLGISNLPDGVISWIQMDMADGDSCADDLVDSGLAINQLGQSGEDMLRIEHGGESQVYFRTMVNGEKGGRYVDLYNDGVAYESKVGYTCLSQRVRMQILKDGWLLQNGMVDEVVWVFTESSFSGTVGATQSVFDLLSQYGIHYVVHLG